MSNSGKTWGAVSAGPPGKPLFTVRRPTRQWVIWAIPGWIIVAIGAVSALVELTDDKPNAVFRAGLSVFFFCGCGALFLLASAGLHRSRIDGFDQHLVVKVGLGKPRPVNATEIVHLQGEAQRTHVITWTSIVGRYARRKKLFQAFTVNVGYQDLIAWLESRCPDAW